MDFVSDFTSLDFIKWEYEKGEKIEYSRRRKPTDNAVLESFNGSF
jgi:transposase InsO family protein